jgi:hypothetical protein
MQDIVQSIRYIFIIFIHSFIHSFIHPFIIQYLFSHFFSPGSFFNYGGCSSVVVNALCQKQEGRGFEDRWDNWILWIYLILPDALGPGFTKPLAEMSTRKEILKGNIYIYVEKSAADGWGWQSRLHLWADCLDNLGSLKSYSPICLHWLLIQSWKYSLDGGSARRMTATYNTA